MIYHPLAVGELLETFECDDKIVAVGYLHDMSKPKQAVDTSLVK